MPIAPADLLTVADELAAGACEAQQRSAVSRHYYAAFHALHAWAQNLPAGASPAGIEGGVHQQFINMLKQPDRRCSVEQSRQSKLFAAQLAILKKRRVTADYDLLGELVPGDVSAQQEQARGVLIKTGLMAR